VDGLATVRAALRAGGNSCWLPCFVAHDTKQSNLTQPIHPPPITAHLKTPPNAAFWRGEPYVQEPFYPDSLSHPKELAWCASFMNALELNATL